jgi:hypothetical protein
MQLNNENSGEARKKFWRGLSPGLCCSSKLPIFLSKKDILIAFE